MLNKLRKDNKKGFTLVELIVVLVILAILAALLIPALTKYIDKAKEKQIVAETRQSVMAAQTIADELYGNGTTTITFNKTTGFTDAAIATLAEVVSSNIKSVTVTGGLVTELKYERDGKECVYTKANATSQAEFKITP